MAKISFEMKEKNTAELHGSQAQDSNYDFPSKKELKNSVKQILDNFTCPECNGNRIKGNGVIVECGKIKMYRELAKKGLFGRTKYTEENFKDVWRIYSITLRSGAFLGPDAGYIKCKSCSWQEKGGKGYKFVSLNDIFSGNI